MFKLFRKKTELEKLIASDGIEHATDRFSEIVARKIPTRELAYQFMLQELDGASRGNSSSKYFAAHSGIPKEQYRNALDNSVPMVDGPGGPQQLLLGLSLELSNDQDLMALFRCKIGDKILQRFKLGKYAASEEQVGLLLESLRNILIDDKDVMPALTSNIPAPASARLRQAHFRAKNISAALELISELKSRTGENNDEIIKKALANFKDNSIPDDLSLMTTEHIEQITKNETPEKMGELLRRAAKAGSTDAAVFMALIMRKGIEALGGPTKVPTEQLQEFEYYLKLAAEQGEVTSQYNLAQHYVCMIGDGSTMDAEKYEFLKKAELWYKRAAKQGDKDSIKALENLKDLLSWAHNAFGN